MPSFVATPNNNDHERMTSCLVSTSYIVLHPYSPCIDFCIEFVKLH